MLRAWRPVGLTNQQLICFFIVHTLALYGSILGIGWGISGVDPFTLHDHFYQFTNSIGMCRKIRSFMQLLWLLGVWLLWTERNNRVFKNVQTTMVDLLEKVKYHSLWWLKAHNAAFIFGNHNWWSNPLLCLSFDWPFRCNYYLTVSFLFGMVSLVHLVLNISHFWFFKNKKKF